MRAELEGIDATRPPAFVWRVVVAGDGSAAPSARVRPATDTAFAFLEVDQNAGVVGAIEIQAATAFSDFADAQGSNIGRHLVDLRPPDRGRPRTPFANNHFADRRALETAERYVSAVPFNMIVKADSDAVPKWTADELDSMMLCFYDDTAAGHHRYRGVTIIKKELGSKDQAEFRAVDNHHEITIDPEAFENGAEHLRMVLQHENGHAIDQISGPTHVRALGAFLGQRRNRHLQTMESTRAMFGAFWEQAFDDVAANPRAPEEYFCTAYARGRVRPDDLHEDLRRFLTRRGL